MLSLSNSNTFEDWFMPGAEVVEPAQNEENIEYDVNYQFQQEQDDGAQRALSQLDEQINQIYEEFGDVKMEDYLLNDSALPDGSQEFDKYLNESSNDSAECATPSAPAPDLVLSSNSNSNSAPNAPAPFVAPSVAPRASLSAPAPSPSLNSISNSNLALNAPAQFTAPMIAPRAPLSAPAPKPTRYELSSNSNLAPNAPVQFLAPSIAPRAPRSAPAPKVARYESPSNSILAPSVPVQFAVPMMAPRANSRAPPPKAARYESSSNLNLAPSTLAPRAAPVIRKKAKKAGAQVQRKTKETPYQRMLRVRANMMKRDPNLFPTNKPLPILYPVKVIRRPVPNAPPRPRAWAHRAHRNQAPAQNQILYPLSSHQMPCNTWPRPQIHDQYGFIGHQQEHQFVMDNGALGAHQEHKMPRDQLFMSSTSGAYVEQENQVPVEQFVMSNDVFSMSQEQFDQWLNYQPLPQHQFVQSTQFGAVGQFQ